MSSAVYFRCDGVASPPTVKFLPDGKALSSLFSETEFDIKCNGDFEIEDMEQAYNFGKIDSKQELLPLLHFIIANRENLHFNFPYHSASDNELFNTQLQNVLDKIERIIKGE